MEEATMMPSFVLIFMILISLPMTFAVEVCRPGTPSEAPGPAPAGESSPVKPKGITAVNDRRILGTLAKYAVDAYNEEQRHKPSSSILVLEEVVKGEYWNSGLGTMYGLTFSARKDDGLTVCTYEALLYQKGTLSTMGSPYKSHPKLVNVEIDKNYQCLF